MLEIIKCIGERQGMLCSHLVLIIWSLVNEIVYPVLSIYKVQYIEILYTTHCVLC